MINTYIFKMSDIKSTMKGEVRMFTLRKKIAATAGCLAILSLLLFPNTAYAKEEAELPLKANYTGHSDTITSLAISPDDKMLISGSDDKTIRIYSIKSSGKDDTQNEEENEEKNIEENQEATLLGRHDGKVNKIVFSPSGDKFASCSTDGAIKLWSTQEKCEISELKSGKDSVNDIVFSKDGDTIYSSEEDGIVTSWNVADGRQKSKFIMSININAIAYNSKDKNLVLACKDGSIMIIDSKDLTIVKTIEDAIGDGSSYGVEKVAVSPDGKYIVCSDRESIQPSIYETKGNYDKVELKENQFNYKDFTMWNDMAFTSDGTYLIGSDKISDHIAMFRFDDGTLEKEADIYPSCFAVSQSRNYFAIANIMDEVNLYDSSKYKPVVMESISIDTDENSFVKDGAVKLSAHVNYSDGSKRQLKDGELQWNTSDSDNSIIDNGIFYSWETGKVNITASYKQFNCSMLVDVAGDTNSGQKINSVACDENGIFAAAGDGGMIKTSSDGTNWKIAESNTTNDINTIIYADGKFAAAGNYSTILISNDGISWRLKGLDKSSNLNFIYWDESKFIVTGEDGTKAESEDGMNWHITDSAEE